ncbi:DUF3084 domain-containing protein [Altericista sp. CCNU0014]|uniref:DUF3084 domain-containing protein n=1 Tax=Altericista sp. CCNU0014 TaxID=3082949 RepID=UPI00384A7F73
MTGTFLILAIVILGGVIATVGDRIGSRVGKARLSLFNMRPKKTAVLVTILTGSITAATTLGVLLAANKELRDIIFRTESIVRQNRKVNQELEQTLAQKSQIQSELSVSRADLIEAVRRLRGVNDSLKVSVQRQKFTEVKLKQLRSRYDFAQTTLRRFGAQAKTLRSQIGQLSTQRQQLVTQRDEILARLKDADSQKQQLEAAARKAQQRIQSVEQQVAQARQQLQSAVAQQASLQRSVSDARVQLKQAADEQNTLRQQRESLGREIAALEENRQRLSENLRVLLLGLRRGNVTIRAGQILAVGVVRDIRDPERALQAINTLRLQARRTAIILTNPQNLPPDRRVVEMAKEDVEGLIRQVSDGKAYVVRILSALNYLEGESQVIAVPQVALNSEVFPPEAVVSTLALTPSSLTDEQILARINALFSAANRRAIESGVLPDPVTGTVGSFRQIELFRFVLALKERNDEEPIEIQAVTSSQVFSSGPLTLSLVALRNGKPILKS